MFNNIGHKIKVLAEVICWIGIIASVLGGLLSMGQKEFVEGINMLIGGPLSSWIGSWVLYAFGQLVENTDSINHKLWNILEKVDHHE